MCQNLSLLSDLGRIGLPGPFQRMAQIHIRFLGERVQKPDDRNSRDVLQNLDLGLLPERFLLLGIELPARLLDLRVNRVNLAVPVGIHQTIV